MKQVLKCIGWALLNFALQMIVNIVYLIPVAAKMTAEEINTYGMDNLLMITMISNELFIAVMYLAGRIKGYRLKERWSIYKPQVKKLIFPMVSGFLFSLGFAFLTFNTSAGNSLPILSSVSYFSEKAAFSGEMLMAVNLLVLAPIAEEMLCRGMMMNGLKERFSENTALVVSSVIFGAMHIMAGGPVLVIGCIIMGLLFGIVYKETGSLIAAIIVHSVANLPDFILMVLPEINDTLRLAFTIGCFIASAVVLEMWFWNKKEEKA